jgi:polyisoprenoid-binding protein YceI
VKSLAGLLLGLAIAGASRAEPVSYALDPTHTFVTFELRSFGLSTLRGRFDRKQGEIVLDRAGRSGRVDITIDTTVVSTGIAPIDAALKGPDGLDSAKHPSARFTSEAFAFDGDKVASVTGRLTVRERSQSIVLKALNYGCYTNPLLKREVCGGDFEARLSRAAFGIDAAVPGIGDEVRLLVQVEAIRP